MRARHLAITLSRRCSELLVRRTKKLGGRGWQRRRAVVKSHYLFLFKNETSETPTGIVNLQGAAFKVVATTSPLGFVLTGADGKEHVFRLPDGADKREQTSWTIALKLARTQKGAKKKETTDQN